MSNNITDSIILDNGIIIPISTIRKAGYSLKKTKVKNPDPLAIENGKRIFFERKKVRHLSRRELGIIVGCHQHYIYQIEKGLVTPSSRLSKRICKALDLHLEMKIDKHNVESATTTVA